MELRLLGPLEVIAGSAPIEVGPAERQCVLAVLAVDRGQLVPVGTLVDRVWADDPPADATARLAYHVSRLREAMVDAGAGEHAAALRHTDGGYRWDVAEDRIDLHRMHALVAASSGVEHVAAVTLLREALGLYRGSPLAGIGGRWAARTRAGLTDQRLALRCRVAELELRLGRHRELLGELAELADEHPWDETVAGLRMLALYRAGRRSDALATYRAVRDRLRAELGEEPGAWLRERHDQILREDAMLVAADVPRLATPRRPLDERAPGGPPAGRRWARAGAWVRRADLPPPPADFTGRTSEIDWLIAGTGGTSGRAGHRSPGADHDSPGAAHDSPGARHDSPGAGHDAGSRKTPNRAPLTVLAIEGVAGVGKSALAARVADQLASACPDGQLYLDLRGYTPGRSPLAPSQALAALLRAVGVPEPRIPSSTRGRAAAWRARVAGRRVLLLLDNARSAEQVEQLLPGQGGCLVIVTSRRGLRSLPAARALVLEPLPPGEAQDLFDRIAGPVAAVDPVSAGEVVRLCAGLPLAVELVAAVLRARPAWTVAALLDRLADTRRGLVELRAGELIVSSAFHVCYHGLTDPARLLFRRLAGYPGDDVDRTAAAALAGLPGAAAERAVAELVDHHLVAHTRGGRYRPHDLLRGFASGLTELQDTAAERDAALDRLLAHDLELATGRSGLDGGELENLIASVLAAAGHGRHDSTWRLAQALCGHLDHHRRYRTALRLCELGLNSARRAGSPAGEQAMLRCTGAMRARCGDEAAPGLLTTREDR